MKTIFILLCGIASTIAQNDNQSPLCTKCSCDNGEVVCNSDIKSILFENSTWLDSEGKVLYDVKRLIIERNYIITLNRVFPESNLTFLNLASNGIATIETGVFRNLQNMSVLILTHNNLESISPEAFQGLYLPGQFMPLKSMRILRLDYNHINSLHMDLFDHMTSIEILSLSYNPIGIIDYHTVTAISGLPKLKELDLSYTGIKTLPDHFVFTPKYLELLDLSGNPITVVPKTLKDNHNLQILHLNDTGFVNLTNENGFPEMPTLKVLHMCHLQNLSNITKHALSGLKNLEDLHLSDNIALTNVDALSLTSVNQEGSIIWPSLKRLHIQNNKITYLDSDFLARWDSLSDLDMRDNPWTCDCENQWIVDELMPQYLKIDEEKAKQIRCAAPIEMEQYTLYDLYEKKSTMRCLDAFGARPERDAAVLIGVLAGVLVTIPLILFLVYAYQRKCFHIFDSSPAAYSRKFYSTQISSDDYF